MSENHTLTVENINLVHQEALHQLASVTSIAELDKIRPDLTGKKSPLITMLKMLGTLNPDERKALGGHLNKVREEIATALDKREHMLQQQALEQKLQQEKQDVSLPPRPDMVGKIHPITQVIDEVRHIFSKMGFQLAEGPDIEREYYNFSALNFPDDHPARQMHDTFYLPTSQDNPELGAVLLRTHTSPVQIHAMRQSQPPLRILAPGRTYRCDSDATHSPMFHQVEGLVVDRNIHMGHLKACVIDFCQTFFGISNLKVRFRPSYFPFTEPSAEMDIGCLRGDGKLKIGEGNDWLEILGCGMVHPNVLKMGGIDPDQYHGFAFGIGIERLAMLKYGIPDLRAFYESDARWLQHYGFSPFEKPSSMMGI